MFELYIGISEYISSQDRLMYKNKLHIENYIINDKNERRLCGKWRKLFFFQGFQQLPHESIKSRL